MVRKLLWLDLGEVEDLETAYVCRWADLHDGHAPEKINRGYLAEFAVTTVLGKQAWAPDNRPYWLFPDVVLNIGGHRVSVQVKANNATYFTLGSLERAAVERGAL